MFCKSPAPVEHLFLEVPGKANDKGSIKATGNLVQRD